MKQSDKKHRRLRGALLTGFLLSSVLFFVFSTIGKQEFEVPHKAALELVGGLQETIANGTVFFKNFWQNYIALFQVRKENASLREDMKKLQQLNNEYREAAATNVRLRKLLELKEAIPPPTLTAEIIGRDPSLWFHTVIINRGSSDGVKKGMPAVTIEGVTGQVMNTSPHHAKVLLAIDPNSAIDVLIQKSRVQGILKGTGEGFKLKYVLNNREVENGDSVVTSGFDGVFPKGLIVGTVAKATKQRQDMFQEIVVIPAVDFSLLEHLVIIMKENSLTE